MDVLHPLDSCEGAYRKPNECSRTFWRRVEDSSGSSVLRRSDSDAMPAFVRHVGFLAERKPDRPRLDTSGKRFVRGPAAELAEHQVVRQYATVGAAELGG